LPLPFSRPGGPLGKLRDGDRIQILIDRNKLEGTVDLVGDAAGDHGPAWGTAELARRAPRPDLAPDPALPADTRLWAALQHASGGVWAGCVYDVDTIAAKLAGR
jgi:dihydroxyacid dehydratase/phosphogluconate dehydratase